MSSFLKELEVLINRYSQEQDSNTPDFILAEYLTHSLSIFNHAVSKREKWYGRSAPSKTISLSTDPVDISNYQFLTKNEEGEWIVRGRNKIKVFMNYYFYSSDPAYCTQEEWDDTYGFEAGVTAEIEKFCKDNEVEYNEWVNEYLANCEREDAEDDCQG